MAHLQLLCDIGELSWIFSNSRDLTTFLQKIVIMVAKHMNADVCSIYLYDDDQDELVLTATEGLNPDSVGRVRLKVGEGLTGLAIKELRPIVERVGSRHPNFRHFEGIDEERYESFLAVPILRGLSKVGVLVTQREERVGFTKDEVLALQAVGSQLANIVENTKLLMALHREGMQAEPSRPTYTGEKIFRGRVASEGYALAQVTVLDKGHSLESLSQLPFDDPCTLEDFARAIEQTEKELEDLQTQVEEKLSDVASLIFAAHLLMLKDEGFVGAIYERIGKGEPPARAVIAVAQHYIGIFSQSPHLYLREKVQDVEDLAVRLISHLLPRKGQCPTSRDSIVVARDLFPSDLLRMASEKVQGIILVRGGVTSHLSILARSLRIPLLIVDQPELLQIPPGSQALLDAHGGQVFLDPGPDLIRVYEMRREALARPAAEPLPADSPCTTRDGTPVRLLATVNLLADLDLAVQFHAQGVGLYRSEFPFLIRSDFPSEEEQYYVYRKVVEGMNGKPVTLRTLDIGGDKVLSYYPNSAEQNPFMGMRSIRFSLQHKDIFGKQIRAMLRAGHGGSLTVLFPMISSLDEFLEARETLQESLRALDAEGVPHNPSPRIGAMIEIPSVLDIIDDLAREADTFSIGTNDLIQYMLAVDRTNEKVASHYTPHHPSILRAIRTVVAAADRHQTDVSICGDMAHDERYIPFFLGIGLRAFSVDPVYLPRIRRAIARADLGETRQVAQALLDFSRASDIAHFLEMRDSNAQKYPSSASDLTFDHSTGSAPPEESEPRNSAQNLL